MELWPWDIELERDTSVTLDVFGKPLRVERINPTTLRYGFGDDPQGAKLVGVSETAHKLRFVPTFGPLPLLIFPQTQLLCPSASSVRCVLRLPLHLQVGVGDKAGFKKLDELAPPSLSRALYGPVDSGMLCTSIHAPNASSIEEINRTSPIEHHQARPHADEAEVSPEDTRELVAYTYLRVRNKTEEPLQVTKVMVPAGGISLYGSGRYVHTNEVSMRLMSAQEAELDFLKCPVPNTVPLADLGGTRTDIAPKKRHFFSHDYRSKTGLEFGF
jgi:hypothetical protein